MAHPSTLYRFRIDLSDIDRGVYETLDFRTAQHPSESMQFLLTRILAYTLNYADGMEFSKEGLADPDAPAIHLPGNQGTPDLWIEIGNPSARKLHKAAKSARQVKVYTYKDPDLLIREITANKIYNAERIEVFSLRPAFLNSLENSVVRDTTWNVIHTDGTLTVTAGDIAVETELQRHPVK